LFFGVVGAKTGLSQTKTAKYTGGIKQIAAKRAINNAARPCVKKTNNDIYFN
jgi:hypothetical protein